MFARFEIWQTLFTKFEFWQSLIAKLLGKQGGQNF
jgi:hypothetical protein